MTPERRFATDIVLRLVEAGYVAFFAGGCVRDQLLKREPHDYDVATSATPNQVRDLFGARRTLLVGASFGVVCVHQMIEGVQHQVEVATFRSDGDYSDGRHPDSVRFTTPEEDAQRRDFTINGLFYDPIEEQVIDYVGGVDDLNAKVLRAIGNPLDRFGEDKLRLMRAIRFAARFDLQLDHETESAIHATASTLLAVSPERIAMEMRKLLVLPKRGWGMEQLFQTGLLGVVSPELDQDWKANTEHVTQSMAVLERFAIGDFPSSVAAILFPSRNSIRSNSAKESVRMTQGRAVAASLKLRWRLANQEEDSIAFYLDSASSLLPSAMDLERNVPWSKIQPWLADGRARRTLDLLDAWSFVTRTPFERLPEFQASLRLPPAELNPPHLIDGSDLHRLGIKPGPHFAQWLAAVRSLQLDQKIVDKAGAIAWLIGQQKELD